MHSGTTPILMVIKSTKFMHHWSMISQPTVKLLFTAAKLNAVPTTKQYYHV
jgi:hypothetical protein